MAMATVERIRGLDDGVLFDLGRRRSGRRIG
jgi:hypothetical protein